MKKLLLSFCFLFILNNFTHAQEFESRDDVKSIELGLTASAVNFTFPGFDFFISYLFFRKGVNSLSFSSTFFTYVNGNAYYKPTFTLFGGLWSLQYRVTTAKGFLFAMETGLGVSGEFATQKVFTVENGFIKDPGVTYGLFSAALRFGYDFYEKYEKSWILDFMIGYRMLFPYNLGISNLFLLGIGLSYSFDLPNK